MKTKKSSHEAHAHATLADVVGDRVAHDLRVAAVVAGSQPDVDPATLRPDAHPTDTQAVILEKADGSDPTAYPDPLNMIADGLKLLAKKVRPEGAGLLGLPFRLVAWEFDMIGDAVRSATAHRVFRFAYVS